MPVGGFVESQASEHAMIKSLQKIEFLDSAGGVTILLNYGDFIADEIEFGADQQTNAFNPIGAPWGLATSEGGARRSFSFSRRQEHASHTEARSYSIYNPAATLFGKQGSVRVSIREAADAPEVIWLLESAVVLSSNPKPLDDGSTKFRSLTTYQITSGSARPLQGNFGHCYPIGMQTYQIGTDETPIGSDECEVVPPYVPDEPNPGIPPSLVDDATIRGFTVSGVTSPSGLNTHFSFFEYVVGLRKWKSEAGDVVYEIDGQYFMMSFPFVEPEFMSTDYPPFPWMANWALNVGGTGLPVLTVDP